MLSNSGLYDVKTFGGLFTWVGQRYSHTVGTRIDRVVATSGWFDVYQNSYVQVLPWQCSNHRALFLHTDCHRRKSHKLFRYDSRWRFNVEVKEHIRNTWMEHCHGIPSANFSNALAICR